MTEARAAEHGGSGGEVPRPIDREGRLSVLVELRTEPGWSPAFALSQANRMDIPGFRLDHEYQPVPLQRTETGTPTGVVETFLVHGTVAGEDDLDALRRRPDVLNAYLDTPIDHFRPSGSGSEPS